MKTVTINKMKVKVFEERELREKLRLNEEEIDLILKHQKTFPELLQDIEGFCINARVLHEKLGVGAEYTTWIKRRIEKYKFVESVDFTRFDKSVKAENTYINTKEYMVNVEMGKELAMVENNELGREVRKYFIIIEKALRSYEDWINVREPQKQGNNELRGVLDKDYKSTHEDIKRTPEYIFSNENDMLNIALLGIKAGKVKELLEYDDRMTRKHFSSDINKALSELQVIDNSLIVANIDFQQRKQIINKTCENKYKELKIEFNKFVQDLEDKAI